MCGRFALTLPPQAMRALFGYVEHPNFPRRYNIAPTQPIAIVRQSREGDAAHRRFGLVRWGFLPSFVKDPKSFPLVFNARAEGLGGKASFRTALRRRRCLVPADAFYEWRRAGPGPGAQAQAFMARRRNAETMALAALWETWVGPNGEEVDTACVVTTEANALSLAIHPRLPVVLEREHWAAWLDPDEGATAEAASLLRPPASDVLEFLPISDAVNHAANDGPEVQEPIGPPLRPHAPVASRPAAAQLDLF